MAGQLIRSTGSDGKEVLSNILDKHTGQYIQFKEIGGIIDADVDGIVYIKKFGKYYKRDIGKEIPINILGKGVDGFVKLVSLGNGSIYKNILITEDINLNGLTVELPENIQLKFAGGVISNGTLIGNKTKIVADRKQIFDSVNLCYVKDSNGRYLYEAPTDMVASGQLDMDASGLWTVAYRAGHHVGRRFRLLGNIDTLLTIGSKVNPADIFDVGLKLNPNSKFEVSEVYPEWFGALADGVTDNYLATQTAIDFAANTGFGVVSFAGNKNPYIFKKGLFLREGTKIKGPRFATAASGGANLRWTVVCEAAIRMIRKPQVEIEGLMLSCIGVGVKNAIVNFESHNLKISECYCIGDFSNAGFLGSSILYPIFYKFAFSLSAKTAWAFMFREDVYDVAYYGVNVGHIDKCNISANNSISHNGGELTIVDSDIEGTIHERGVIELKYYPSSTTLLRILNSYFECSPQAGIASSAIIRSGSSAVLICRGNVVFGQASRVAADISFLAPLQGINQVSITLDITGGNRFSRFTTVFKNVTTGANITHTENGNTYEFCENVFNYFGGTGLRDNGFNRSDVLDTVVVEGAGVRENHFDDPRFDKKNLIALNHGRLYSSGFWVEKTKPNGFIYIGFGNRVAWYGGEEATITNLMNSGKIRGTPVFFSNATNHKVTLSHNKPYKWGMFEIVNSGFGYPEDTPTINVAGYPNLILVPRVEGGVITDVVVARSTTVAAASPAITVVDKKGGSGASFTLVKNAKNHVIGVTVSNGGSGYGGVTLNIPDYGNTTRIFPMIINGRLIGVFTNFDNVIPTNINNALITVNSTPSPITAAQFRTDVSGPIWSPNGKDIVLNQRDSVEGYVSNDSVLVITKISRNNETGWLRGTTAQRPSDASLLPQGHQYFDTTLGRPVWWNGSSWKDAAGETV